MLEPIVNLYLVVAQECNLRCGYCYAGGGGFGQATPRMAEATLDRALNRLLPLAGNRVTVSFFGGEPLLAFDLLEAAVARAGRLAAGLGKTVEFALTSNGTLIERGMLPFLKAHIDYLAISLDGDETANGGRRFLDGGPTAAAILERLAWLREAEIPFALRATLTPANVDLALASADFLAGLGAASVRMLPAHGMAWPAAAR
ncbi:MAG: radical SAM protein, partial [Thiobacillus sp.]|nr:radical SAM protein [Thiobacillus sp.]